MGSVRVDGNRVIELDALIVGAGFGGIWQLKKLRDQGFNVKLIEGGSDFGGVWYWNRYPGARVDSPVPHYEFSDPDLWTDWHWSQRFPGSEEIRAYFAYVAEKWQLRRDCHFNTWVDSAAWNETESRWIITVRDGSTFKARFFLPNTGFAAKRHIPDWKGIDSFEGTWVHPSYWPKLGPELEGKKIAVVGTGATGIQLTQELAPIASEFCLFQRTPNLTLPMMQKNYCGESNEAPAVSKDRHSALYTGRKESFGGFDFNFMPTTTFEHSKEQREETYERLWQEGGFHFWMATYSDMLLSDEANTEAYNFWRNKIRQRISDPILQEKLAPTIKPHAFGCKRVSLENGFYELFSKPNVHLVDTKETPIVEVTPKGIKTIEREWEFDYVVSATGFDAITGGILAMNVTGRDGVTLNENWKGGVKTLMGITVSGFPNMFFTYGPQAPTAFCNGPTCAEMQGNWIVDVLKHMRAKRLSSIDATIESEKAWAEAIWTIANMSLLPSVKSWYMGDNIPGKTREPLIYLGGVPTYYKTLNECAASGYQGMVLS